MISILNGSPNSFHHGKWAKDNPIQRIQINLEPQDQEPSTNAKKGKHEIDQKKPKKHKDTNISKNSWQIQEIKQKKLNAKNYQSKKIVEKRGGQKLTKKIEFGRD